MTSFARSSERRRSILRLQAVVPILLLCTMAQAQVQRDAENNTTRAAAVAPRVTRTAPGVMNPAAGTDAAIEREAQRQRDIRTFLIRPLYRDPTRQELASVAVDEELRREFAGFLTLHGTGITNLLPDIGCYESARIVSAAPECLARAMPGNGSHFSFRKKNYTVRRFADLFMGKTTLAATGQYSQAAFAVLGDTPIEKVDLSNAQVRALSAIPRASTLAEAQRPISGFIRAFVPKEGNTYAMRNIAYRGEIKRSVRGVVYNELKYDRRADVVVAFRVLRISPEGTVTIVWRVLSDERSPELKK